MFTLIIRALIVYLIVLFVFRLMGKRQLGQMQPFEFVLALIIADLATIPMAESSVPILHGIVPLLTLVTLHYFLTIITKKSEIFNKIISGKPVIVINPRGIDYESLKNLNITIDDLFESVRGCGYFSLDEIEYAIVETNGNVNVLAKKDFSPVTINDISSFCESDKRSTNLQKIDENTIPITIIADGNINKNNLKLANWSENIINNILKITNTKKIKDILILTVDGNGKIYFQRKKENFIILNYNNLKENL